MTDDRLRIDKWLWFARLARTRTAAQRLAISGRVRVNREKNQSSARQVKIGDVLTITFESVVRILRISAIGTRRGGAQDARLLYEDLSPPRPAEKDKVRAPGNSRPTKRQRRALDNFRAEFSNRNSDFSSGLDGEAK